MQFDEIGQMQVLYILESSANVFVNGDWLIFNVF